MLPRKDRLEMAREVMSRAADSVGDALSLLLQEEPISTELLDLFGAVGAMEDRLALMVKEETSNV